MLFSGHSLSLTLPLSLSLTLPSSFLYVGLNIFYSYIKYTEKDWLGVKCNITLSSPLPLCYKLSHSFSLSLSRSLSLSHLHPTLTHLISLNLSLTHPLSHSLHTLVFPLMTSIWPLLAGEVVKHPSIHPSSSL